MSRVKRGPFPRRRHKRVFEQTKGFWGGRKNRYRQAVKVLWKSWQYAYAGRKLKKRDFRSLWIVRINAACRENGTTYSRLIGKLKVAGIDHVGLGSDFDGAIMPLGLEDASKLPKITSELQRRGYSDRDVTKILGENLLRVMGQTELRRGAASTKK